jgi:hypothetical protein
MLAYFGYSFFETNLDRSKKQVEILLLPISKNFIAAEVSVSHIKSSSLRFMKSRKFP